MLSVEAVNPPILGDPGADSGGKGKTKRAEKNGAKKSKEMYTLLDLHNSLKDTQSHSLIVN